MKRKASQKFAHALSKISQGNRLVREGYADLVAALRSLRQEELARAAQEARTESVPTPGTLGRPNGAEGRL